MVEDDRNRHFRCLFSRHLEFSATRKALKILLRERLQTGRAVLLARNSPAKQIAGPSALNQLRGISLRCIAS
jgi:hypothetical protein